MSAGPTVSDEVAHTLLCFGGVRGTYSALKAGGIPIDIAYGQSLDVHMHYMKARDNLFRASVGGLDAKFIGVRGEKSSAREFLLQRLLPAAHLGLERAGVKQETIVHYLDLIARKLEFRWESVPNLPPGWGSKVGFTGADLQLYVDFQLRCRGGEFASDLARGCEITRMIYQAQEYDRIYAESHGRGCGVLGWFQESYLPSIRH